MMHSNVLWAMDREVSHLQKLWTITSPNTQSARPAWLVKSNLCEIHELWKKKPDQVSLNRTLKICRNFVKILQRDHWSPKHLKILEGHRFTEVNKPLSSSFSGSPGLSLAFPTVCASPYRKAPVHFAQLQVWQVWQVLQVQQVQQVQQGVQTCDGRNPAPFGRWVIRDS